jgi:hypothetical protein
MGSNAEACGRFLMARLVVDCKKKVRCVHRKSIPSGTDSRRSVETSLDTARRSACATTSRTRNQQNPDVGDVGARGPGLEQSIERLEEVVGIVVVEKPAGVETEGRGSGER